jgi:hypothetical protein
MEATSAALAAVGATPGTSGAAHSPQNFAVVEFGAPQAGQTAARRVAHSLQNLRPAPFSVPQFEQITERPSDVRERGYRRSSIADRGSAGGGVEQGPVGRQYLARPEGVRSVRTTTLMKGPHRRSATSVD